MTIRNDAAAAAAAAARRAAEEARRRAAEAARRAAEAAAKQAAQAAVKQAAAAAAKAAQAAAQKKAAQAISARAGQRPAASAVRQAFGRDEMSQGLGRALRQRSAAALGGAPAAILRGPPPGGVQASRLDTQPNRTGSTSTTSAPRQPTAQEVYDRELRGTVQKPLSEWSRQDAANFTSALADQVEEHSDDPEFVRGLMTLSSERLQNVARLTGDASNDKGDEAQTHAMTAELTRLGNALPDDMAARLASGIAAEINEDSEQHYVDDGFGRAIEDGASGDFRDLIAASLVSQGKEDAAEELIETEGGSGLTDRLGDLADRVSDLVDGAGNLAGDAWDFGGDALQVAGQGLEAAGSGLDDLTDALVPQVVQDVLGNTPVGPLLHAGQSIEDLGQTIQDLPEFVDAIRQAASYRGQISDLGEGDSFTMGASGDLAISGIVGSVEGEIAINRGEDVNGTPQYTVSVGGELGLGVGGPLAEGVDGNISATAGGAVEYTFDSPEAAKRGVDIIMANALGRSGLVGAGADALGISERIFGASNDDLDELSRSQSAVTLSAGAAAELSASLAPDLGASFEGGGEHSVRIEYDHGDIAGVVLQTELSAGASGTVGTGGNNVSGGASGSVSVSQGFDAPPGTSLADLLRNPGDLTRQQDAELTFNAEVRGGSQVTAGTADNNVSLTENEGVQASATVSGDPLELLQSGALDEILRGNFEGALDALQSVSDEEGGLHIDAQVRRFTTDGASATVGGGSGGNGGHVGVRAEQRDFADEPLAEFNGDLAEVREDLSRLQRQIAQRALDATTLRFLTPILG